MFIWKIVTFVKPKKIDILEMQLCIWNVLARIETSWLVRSGFTRCLHYLTASLEHVRRSTWSLPLPVTLENVSVRWTLALSVRWPVRLRRSPAGNVASTKFPSPRPPTVPSFLVPFFLVASRSLARFLSFAVASLLLFLIYESTICPWTPAFSSFILSPFSLALSLIYEQLCFSWYTRAFGSRAVSIETPRREKGGRRRIGTPARVQGRRVAIREWKYDGVG